MRACIRVPLALFALAFLAASTGATRDATSRPTGLPMRPTLLDALPSPVLIRGDDHVAYRDPAALLVDGTLHLFFRLVETETAGDAPYMYVATSTTTDLRTWTPVRKLTPRDRALNFSSPGNVVRFDGRWVMCLQTYCRPNGEKYGNGDSRIWIVRSDDLTTWDAPELLRVKGPDVAVNEMGRMIDPFLIEDANEPGKWWCLFKQNGVSRAWSRDLKTWTFAGRTEAGENACVVRNAEDYVLLHSPPNGIGVRRSMDLEHWTDEGTLTLGQAAWPWARGRLTAGFVLDLRGARGFGKWVMFFHASGPEDESTMFDTHASLGIAWSEDLRAWQWPADRREPVP